MFIVRKSEDKPVKWPVAIEVSKDGGKTQKHEFEGKFLRLNSDQKKKIDEELDSLNDKNGDEFISAWVDRTMRIMVGWSGVVDEENKPIEFSEAALREVAAGPVGIAFMAAVGRAVAQIEAGVRAKN